MNHLQALRDIGQSLWLDNITREILDNGTLKRYIDDFSVTGLTSNPTIFDEAIGNSGAYDAGIREKGSAGKEGEELFVELALEDLRRAADLFRPVFDATHGVDGWVSMELSPLLAADTAGSIQAASRIHAQADRVNLFVKIPGTPEGVKAIEESIFNGVPINVTLLFSKVQYLAAAEAYLRGIERRIEAGLSPVVGSVASLFVSRWDKASADQLPEELHNQLGIAMRIASCWHRRAGKSWPKPAHSRSDCCGQVPAPRIRMRPTRFTSRRSLHPTPSTRFLKKPFWLLPTTGTRASRWPKTEALRK
jgi:transaldolase